MSRRRLPAIAAALLLCGLWLGLQACANPHSNRHDRENDRRRRDSGEYYRGGSVHSNSFPETFGGGGPERIGRPERQFFQ